MSVAVKNKKGVNTAIASMVVLGVSLAVPVIGAGMASAATVDQWDRIAQCESSGRWNLPYGHADSTGGLQFQRASWNDALAYLRSKGVDTSAYPSVAYQATKQQQIMAGEALLALQGPGAWVCNSMTGYPLGSSSSSSMFKGGPNPYPATTTPTTPTTPKPTTPTVPSTPAAGDKYTVKAGDTLGKIATEQKVSGGWQALYSANKSVIGSDPNLIYPGQKLSLPAVKYTVKKGDTLSGIASALKVKGGWQSLYAANKSVIGSDPNKIEIGMVLTVSGGVSTPSTPTTPTTPKPPTTPTTPSTASWVGPLAKGTYYKGDNINVASGCISRTCGGHSGLDMIAPAGTPAKAISAGTVVHAGYGYAGAAYGNHVVLKLADGKYALYGHLSSNNVRAGQSVSVGQMIGSVGSTGNSSGPHLHFEIRNSPNQFSVGVFSNPVTYLASKGVTI